MYKVLTEYWLIRNIEDEKKKVWYRIFDFFFSIIFAVITRIKFFDKIYQWFIFWEETFFWVYLATLSARIVLIYDIDKKKLIKW